MSTDDTISLLDSLGPAAAGAREAGKLHAQRAHDDYSTPEHYVELVRAALGGRIGCDPASSAADNVVICAEVHWHADDSGLAHEWPGPVYLNPPSARRDEFLARAAHEAAAGCEIVVCLNLKHLCAGYTQALLPHVAAMHVPRGRPAFVHPVTRARSESPTDGRAFLYCGAHPERFCAAFATDKGWTALTARQAPRRAPRPRAEVI